MQPFCIGCALFVLQLVALAICPCLAQRADGVHPGIAAIEREGGPGSGPGGGPGGGPGPGKHREPQRSGDIPSGEAPDMEEVSVTLCASNIGNYELRAVIYRDEAFIPISELFTFLGIMNTPSLSGDSISGFFADEEKRYLIDATTHRIKFQDNVFEVGSAAFILRSDKLLLSAKYFEQVFGLECAFHFRSLSISVQSKIELPAIRELRNREMRKNIRRLTGEVQADTTYPRSFPIFFPGVLDWSVYSTQARGTTTTRGTFALGSAMLGGDTRAALHLTSSAPVTVQDVSFLWQYVNDDNTVLRQVFLGQIPVNRIATMYRPILGAQFTNAPKKLRKSFGSYPVDDVTVPGWIVELYINDVLVDYTKADATGSVHFDVPLVYGSSAVKLRYCGPYGEERIREQNFTIPFSFLPPGEMEYNAAAGVIEDGSMNPFLRADMKFGLTRFFTAGGGVEYVTKDTTKGTIPFVNASLALAPSLMLSAEYAHGVSFQSAVQWSLPSSFRCEAQYRLYAQRQTMINTSYLDELRASMWWSISASGFSVQPRLSVSRLRFAEDQYTAMDAAFALNTFGVNANITHTAILVQRGSAIVMGTAHIALRLPLEIQARPGLVYDYSQHSFTSLRCALDRRVMSKGLVQISYEYNPNSGSSMVTAGISYDLPFARLGTSGSENDGHVSASQAFSGSLSYDKAARRIDASLMSSVGRGALQIRTFLDVNGNGQRDLDETGVKGVNARVSNGRVELDTTDSTLRVYDLEAYTKCLIELVDAGFERAAWQMKKKSISVSVIPNQTQTIDVPVSVCGEAEGDVLRHDASKNKGAARITICFFSEDSTLFAKALTEDDGTFSYLGFAPGTYLAKPDPRQLAKLGLRSEPAERRFTIRATRDGDLFSELHFELRAADEQRPEEQPDQHGKSITGEDPK
jgi:hypothetical protein